MLQNRNRWRHKTNLHFFNKHLTKLMFTTSELFVMTFIEYSILFDFFLRLYSSFYSLGYFTISTQSKFFVMFLNMNANMGTLF